MSQGNFYYCIKTGLSKIGEIYAYADKVNVGADGSLRMIRDDGLPLMIIPSGNWDCIYAASMLDGAAVSVEHWEGEYISDIDKS